jgi:C-terminal processing protease CtpA/Prc
MFRDDLERMAQIYGGIAIFSVEPGSTTYRAGVRSGDILVEVNGHRVRRAGDYASARRRRSKLLELVVVRSGRQVRLWTADEGRKKPPPETDALPALIRRVNCATYGRT